MKTKKEFKNMLANASTIQYWANVLEGTRVKYYPNGREESFDPYGYYEAKCDPGFRPWYIYPHWEYYDTESNRWVDLPTDKEVMAAIRFIIKRRKLKGGLANPMARYYGYRAIEKID